MNLKQLEAFVKIANNRSFSRTAKELYLTQPTVSAYISKLEYELGTKLFVRTTKDVELSEDGEKIYLYAKEIVELADKIEHTFSGSKEEGTRQIVVSASSIPGTYLLPGILANFNKKYPNVEFRVNETDSAGVVADIMEHHADIGFAGTVMGTKNIQYIPFYQDELVLVVPNTTEYIEKSRDTDDYSWLQSEPWLLRSRGSGTQKESDRLLTGLGIETERLRVIARFNNTGAILLSIREGTGVAIVSRLAAAAAIERGEVLAVPLGKNGAFRSINMVISSMYPLSDGGKKLVHFVKEMYKT